MYRVIILLLLFPGVATAQAASITVAWDASPSTNMVGYRVYYRTSTNQPYASSQNTFGLQHTITNLTWGTRYWIVAVAVATNGVESDYSNEVTAMTPRPEPPTNLRVITNALQGAATPNGPWTNLASYAVDVPLDEASMFYRARLDWGFK